ncbi:MAG: hypothetical protein ACFWUE_04965 [Xylanivirga thermophila]|jgi:hypothetical protein|uniref:hypothetical protein n=1 Tax=Xylanivirga thermophila TaxID=2496273 RepID=UPI0039F5844F
MKVFFFDKKNIMWIVIVIIVIIALSIILRIANSSVSSFDTGIALRTMKYFPS